MATVTLIFTSNADGTLSGSSTSAAANPYPNTTSLKALMNWAKGVVYVTLVGGNNVVASD
jgi:hypothetical protein